MTTLKNGLTLITVNLPHLESVTTMVAVGAGSRYETRANNGISHFLEHMFFKGSRKYPTAEIIANLVDGIGAVNNAATSKEYTFYWIKSAAKHIELASDILSSQVKESLLSEEEINRERGVIIEEMRRIKDNPAVYVFYLYELLQFGDQPLGWDVIGSEKTILKMDRPDFVSYINSLYSPKNMTLVYVGKLPQNIKKMAEDYFSDLPQRSSFDPQPYELQKQIKPKVDVVYKDTQQVNLVMGAQGYDQDDPRRYAARMLAIILGEGMSSRLFVQIRERRGLAYHIAADHESLRDTGLFEVYAGLKLEKIDEGLQTIKAELMRTVSEKVTEEELKKAKEMERGRLALRSESTNFLAEYFGVRFVLERKIETFEDYLKKIDAVREEDIRKVAGELFKDNRFNLQIIGPFKNPEQFEKILQG